MKMEGITKWVNKNGNRCFRFQERQVYERSWILVIAFSICFAIVGIEYLVNSSYYAILPCFIGFFFAFLWWITLPMKANESIIEIITHDLMNSIVEADAKSLGTEVEKSFVHYDTRGTYAIITGRCFLVLLKNGEVWEYPIIYHKSTDKRDGYYECVVKRISGVDDEHLKAIKPQRLRRFMSRLALSEKAKLWLFILLIVAIGSLSFLGIYWLVKELKLWMLLVIVGYVVLLGVADGLVKRFPGKTLGFVRSIVSMQVAFVYMVISLTQPFLTIVGTYFFIAIFTFGVPAIILTGVSLLEWWNLRPETIAFVVIALGSVLCTMYPITKWIIRHTPLKNWGNHIYESHREQLAMYLAHPSNMIFILYFAYLVLLVVSGYMLIQEGRSLISESFDLAILKAFLVFIAYTNMKIKAKETEMDAKELLQRISGLFVHDSYE